MKERNRTERVLSHKKGRNADLKQKRDEAIRKDADKWFNKEKIRFDVILERLREKYYLSDLTLERIIKAKKNPV